MNTFRFCSNRCIIHGVRFIVFKTLQIHTINKIIYHYNHAQPLFIQHIFYITMKDNKGLI